MVGRFRGMQNLSAKALKISCLMGRLHTRDVLENLLKDRSFRFGSLVEYYPMSAKDQSRIHQFGKKVLPGLFLDCSLGTLCTRE